MNKKERIQAWDRRFLEKVVLIVEFLSGENNIGRKELAEITTFSEEQIEDMLSGRSELNEHFIENINRRFNLKLKR